MKLLLAGALLGTLILAGAASAQGSPPEHVVTMTSMSYGRIPSDLKVGDTVTFINRDTVAHTVTARDHSFDLHVNPGKSAHLTLQKPGSFPFYCNYHTTMRGTLSVAAK